jgi:hypothetical protein
MHQWLQYKRTVNTVYKVNDDDQFWQAVLHSIYSQTCPCSHLYKAVWPSSHLYKAVWPSSHLYKAVWPSSHLYKAVTCIKRSPFSCPVVEHFIWIDPLLRGSLSYKATLSLSKRWPLNTGLTSIYPVFRFYIEIESHEIAIICLKLSTTSWFYFNLL